ncbi:MAG: serine/threonine-protein kinase [Myxococcales bacterium]
MADQASRFQFGSYVLLHRLGHGGMAELFLATRADAAPDDPPLVIKRILPSMGENPEFCSMFLNEARVAAQLIHPNIVRVLDLGQVDDQLYVALEFIDGLDLSQILSARGRLSAPVAARIALGVCEALAYAHEAKDLQGNALDVVHRDVSPDNVMVTRHGGIKLIDFGIAKVLSQSGMTRPGIIKGKYGYIAPEYMRGIGLDGRADLFSLGAMLYETITGAQPFERGNAEQTMARVLGFEPLPPTELVPSCPKDFSGIVQRALQKSPELRFASARQMASELKAFLDGCGQTVGAAELAALTWAPASEPSSPGPLEAGAPLEPPIGSQASVDGLSPDGPLTMPLLGAILPMRVERPPSARPVSRPTRGVEAAKKPGVLKLVAKGAGLGVLVLGAALLGRWSAATGTAAKVAPGSAPEAAVGSVAEGPDASELEDVGHAGDDAAAASSALFGLDPADAGATKAERTLLQVKGRGNVLVDGKLCQAPCTIKVQPGSHVVERGGKKRFRKTVQVPAGTVYVFNVP